MRAAGLDYEHKRVGSLAIPEPAPPGPGEVLFRVREVGICGTDRELASFAIGFPPEGESVLVLGHEALGEVVETGSEVREFRKGDWIVPSIRRSCSPPCASCAHGRRDLCLTGKALERGIFGLHGYMTEYAVDSAADLVRVPDPLVDVAVLIEPLSVVEKAVAKALRMHAGEPQRALVLGAGPIGLLAAMVLRLRGLEVAVHSIEPPDHPRARLARVAGLRYVERPEAGSADVIIEATGSAEAAFAGFGALAALGVYAILGSPNARGEMPFLDLLVKNQIVFGSVNAGPDALAAAVEDLPSLERAVLARMINRVGFERVAETVSRPSGIKTVHVMP